ncbi:hypothetical protein FDZ74_12535, partial [bacterium]
MIELHNSTLNFIGDPDKGSFALQPADEALPALWGARMRVLYRVKGRPVDLLADGWPVTNATSLPRSPSLLGLLNQVELQLAPDDNGLTGHITFALSDLLPMLLWKVSLENRGTEPLTLDRIEMLR